MTNQGTDQRNITAKALSETQASMPSLQSLEAAMLDQVRSDMLAFNQRAVSDTGHDISGLVGLSRKLSTEIREHLMPQNGEAATPSEVMTAFAEIRRCVFLPRHEVLDGRMLGTIYEVIAGRIDPSSYTSEMYLGTELKTAHVTFTHGLSNSMGLSIENLAMIDPSLIREDCNVFYGQLKVLARVDSFARELETFIVNKRVSKQDYYKVAGYERLLKEEVQHSKDAIFIERITKGERSGSVKRREDVLLKPESALRQMLKYDNEESNFGSAALSEYSSSVGGIIMELDNYIARQQWDSAKLAVLDFLVQQHFRMETQQVGAMRALYQLGAKAFFARLKEVMPDARDAGQVVSRLFSGATPQQQVQRCRKIFTELRGKDLWADWERKNLLSA